MLINDVSNDDNCALTKKKKTYTDLLLNIIIKPIICITKKMKMLQPSGNISILWDLYKLLWNSWIIFYCTVNVFFGFGIHFN